MPGDDAVLPFQLDALEMRGRVARLDATLDRILTQHAYPPSVGALVGEAVLLTTLIGQAMKLRGRFSLQARGDGPVALIATDYVAPTAPGEPARLRAYAKFDAETTPETSLDPAALLGDGLFAMTIDQGAHMQPYQGLTPLAAGGLRASAEVYFAQSEQVATKFVVAIGRSEAPGGGAASWRAGGVMIQHLPERSAPRDAPGGDGPTGPDGLMRPEDVAALDDRADEWRTAALLLDTVEEIELIGPHVSPEQLLFRLFHQVGPRVFPVEPVAFGCSCSSDKVEAVLTSYSATELTEMAEADGAIYADCQFCGARYGFDPAALADGRAR